MSENIKFPDALQLQMNKLVDMISALKISTKEKIDLAEEVKLLCNSCSILAASSVIESIKKSANPTETILGLTKEPAK